MRIGVVSYYKYEDYIYLYEDLRNLSKSDALKHYVYYGKKEGYEN